MPCCTSLLLLLSVISITLAVNNQTETWTGVYTINNNSTCPSLDCCCLVDNITITQVANDQIQVEGPVTGCGSQTNMVTVPISLTSWNQTTASFPWLGHQFILTRAGLDLIVADVNSVQCQSRATCEDGACMIVTKSPSNDTNGPKPWHAVLIVGSGVLVFVGVIVAIFFFAVPAWKRKEYEELNGDKELKPMHGHTAV